MARSISLNATDSGASAVRPIGIAEPVRRLSTGLMRSWKGADVETECHSDKSVQVNTIIRSCGRCAGSLSPMITMRKHSTLTSSSSSITGNNSSCDDGDDDSTPFTPPNMDQLRQRRATLVAKTIIDQMTAQSPSSSMDELVPPMFGSISQRRYSSPMSVRCSVKVSKSSDTALKRGNSREEFREISKQISALLTPSDDEM